MSACPYTDDTTAHEHWWFGYGDAENPASVMRPVLMSQDPAERLAYRQGVRAGLEAVNAVA